VADDRWARPAGPCVWPALNKHRPETLRADQDLFRLRLLLCALQLLPRLCAVFPPVLRLGCLSRWARVDAR
jgi:hypothetical protein